MPQSVIVLKLVKVFLIQSILFEPPFTEINDQGITGVFDEVMAGKIIRIIDEVNTIAVKNIG
jgi:type I restriction enzyme R subunit